MLPTSTDFFLYLILLCFVVPASAESFVDEMVSDEVVVADTSVSLLVVVVVALWLLILHSFGNRFVVVCWNECADEEGDVELVISAFGSVESRLCRCCLRHFCNLRLADKLRSVLTRPLFVSALLFLRLILAQNDPLLCLIGRLISDIGDEIAAVV